MGEFNNRYYGGMNKEGQIRSNSFHSRTSVRQISIDTDKLEQKAQTSSAGTSAAETSASAATSSATTSAVTTAPSAAISAGSAVAGGTAAAVATATVVVVASAIFVPSVKEFKYESTANTISYSFNLSYKNGDSAVVTLENRLEKYVERFELASYFSEEETAENDEGIILFKEGRFTDLIPSTTYNLSISLLDGDNKYDVFSERVKTNDIPPSDFVITADLALNEEAQCLEGMINVDDPGHYYEDGSVYAEIIGNRSEYPETTDISGNEFEEDFDEITMKIKRVYKVSDLSTVQSFYVGGFDGGEEGLSLTIYAKSNYKGGGEPKQYFQKNYQYNAPVTYVTFNFYNDDGTVLWDSQTIPYGVEVTYKGSVDLDEEASRRSSDTKTFFLGWASRVEGEPYDGPMYAFEDRDYYAVFGEKTHAVTLYDGQNIIYRTYVTHGDTFCIDESEASGYDFFKEPDANGCYSFDHYVNADGEIVFGYEEITVTEDVDLFATYVVTSQSVHTIFYDYDGTTVLQDNYQPAYSGVYYDTSLPTREGETADTKYRFIGWKCLEMDERFISNNEMNDLATEKYGGRTLTFVATYVEGEYIVNFYNENGTELLATQYAYEGEQAQYPNDEPLTKEPTETTEYGFIGWDTRPNGEEGRPELPAVTGDIAYYAVFAEAPREYTVTVYDEDRTTVLLTVPVAYGDMFCIDESDIGGYDFMKEPDADGCYSFDHLLDKDGNIVFGYEENEVKGDIDLYASYVVTSQSVHIIFYNYDGTTVLQDNYQMANYGIVYEGEEPQRESPGDGSYYTFGFWSSPELGTDVYPEDLASYNISSRGGQTITFIAQFNQIA